MERAAERGAGGPHRGTRARGRALSGRLAFGLVGAGGIAQSYARAFQLSRRARLAGVADLRPEAARALGEAYGCPGYASHVALREALRLDAVIVCTPPASHTELCLDFLDAGVPVLCEKPLSIDSAEARRVLETAARMGLTFTMASKFRYVEDVVRAKGLVTSGVVGEVVLFENAFTSRVDMAQRWNSRPEVSGGGVLIDNGTHSVDLMRYFLGPLAEVHVVEGKRSQGLPVEETVRIFVRSRAGVLGSIDLSWSINKELDSYLNLYGSHGTVSVGWLQSRYRLSGREWEVFGRGYDKLQALASQIDNFAGAIRGEEALLITPEDALASVEVIEAAYADLRRSHWLAVGGAGPERRPARGGRAVGGRA